jgi:hypothetical protein
VQISQRTLIRRGNDKVTFYSIIIFFLSTDSFHKNEAFGLVRGTVKLNIFNSTFMKNRQKYSAILFQEENLQSQHGYRNPIKYIPSHLDLHLTTVLHEHRISICHQEKFKTECKPVIKDAWQTC